MAAEKRAVRATAEPVEFRAGSDGKVGTISGYGAVYWRDDDPGTEYRLFEGVVERIMPGAFAAVLEGESDVLALREHNPSLILGRRSSGTLRLSADGRGLRYEVDLPQTSEGRDTRELAIRGDLNGASIGMVVETEDWRREDGLEIREIRKAGLRDVGPVTFPAYTSTTAEARSEDWVETRRSWREKHPPRARQSADSRSRTARAAEVDLELDEIQRGGADG